VDRPSRRCNLQFHLYKYVAQFVSVLVCNIYLLIQSITKCLLLHVWCTTTDDGLSVNCTVLISTPVGAGLLSARRRGRNSKFRFLEIVSPTYRICMPSFRRRRPSGLGALWVLKMLAPHRRTYIVGLRTRVVWTDWHLTSFKEVISGEMINKCNIIFIRAVILICCRPH